jgi:hypothetical protein
MARLFRILAALSVLIGLGWSQAHAQVPMTGAGRGAPSSAATCASVLPGLVVNLDASVTASVHLSGSSVTQWDDQSGNGNNFVQATGARQPTFSATGFNATKPGVTVVAANAQFVQNTAVPFNSANLSIFAVITTTANSPINSGMVSFVGAGQADDFSNNASFVLSGDTSVVGVYKAVSNTINDSSFSDTGGPDAFGAVFNGTNGTAYKNFTAGTPAAKVGAFGNTTANIAVGTRPWNGNTPSFDGTYAEVILTSGVISGGTLTTLHTCLSTKWGVP